VRIASLAAAIGALVLFAAPVSANGRFPASNRLLFSPSDPNLVILRTTFGTLLSHDAGTTWSWLCDEAVGLPTASSDDPSLAVTANGTIVGGIYSGLEISVDKGCNWRFVGGALSNQVITDVAARRDAPHTVVALTSTYQSNAGPDGGAGYVSRVYQSTDDGANWSSLGTPLDSSVVTTTMDVAASDPHRLYVAAVRPPTTLNPSNAASLFVSTDDGRHWTERALPPLVREIAAYIAAVDPANADLVYLRSDGQPDVTVPTQSRLFVTRDAGQSFQVALTFATPMLGFALSPDGSKVYAGSTRDGVLVAARANVGSPHAFLSKMSPIHVQCLATHGSDLWACSDEVSGFIAGLSTDDGATFAAKLHLNGIQAPLACDPDATAAQCSGDSFRRLCDNFGGCAGWDAGIDGGAAGGDDAGAIRSARPAKGSCGCSVVGGGGGVMGLVAAAGVVAIAARRRRGTAAGRERLA
jgi:MYXO-CTERM domain-containing protein